MTDEVGTEATPNPETYKTVQRFVKEVQEMMIETYDLKEKDIPDASKMVWDKTDAELKTRLKRDLLPDATTYSVETPEGEFLGSVIHFPKTMMEHLAHSTSKSRLTGDHLPDMLDLIEETSHFTYELFYRKQYPGQKPHSAVVEMIGVIDKFNILQGLFRKTFGVSMTTADQVRSIHHNAIAAEDQNWPGDRPGDYVVGHELGAQYVSYLNNQYNQGRDVSEELLSFYRMSNQQQIRHVFYDLGHTVQTRSAAEDASVANVFQEIGVPLAKQ